ncbi:hypothetical protein Scep_008906 [Stephania cephalantha]|uniref:Pre-mRNA-splicing helicase BRR2-like plug domain-containing protein n=1 Tax=Stephania cephalantha TaxID=152367 RepID=A0AAP0PFT4_9MAGN
MERFSILCDSRQNFKEEKVIDTLRIFTLAAPDDNLRVLDFAESCRRTIDDESGAWSGGFEESQNELGSVRRRRYMPHEHEQRRRVIEMVMIDAVEKMKNEGERSVFSSSFPEVYFPRFFRRGMSDYILFDLMVFIIDKLFAEFRCCWYDVIVSVKEAAINHAKSPLYGDEEVIGALFRGGAKFWLPEEPSTAYCSILLANQLSRDGDKVADKEVIGEGFKDSENELKDSGFSSSSSSSHSLHYHNQQLFLSRKVEVLGKESQEGSHEGEFPSMVIQGMADIVLWILKSNDYFNNPIDKRVEIEKVLDKITDQVFQQMLDIAQSITDFTTTTHPYIYEFHNDQPIKTMQNIVAYNLLIRVFEDGPWSRPRRRFYICREKSYEMLLILNNESVKPMDTQQAMIDNLLKGFLSTWDDDEESVENEEDSGGFKESENLLAMLWLLLLEISPIIIDRCFVAKGWWRSFSGGREIKS